MLEACHKDVRRRKEEKERGKWLKEGRKEGWMDGWVDERKKGTEEDRR